MDGRKLPVRGTWVALAPNGGPVSRDDYYTKMVEDELFAAIKERRNDPEFMERLRASVQRNQAILRRLAEMEDR